MDRYTRLNKERVRITATELDQHAKFIEQSNVIDLTAELTKKTAEFLQYLRLCVFEMCDRDPKNVEDYEIYTGSKLISDMVGRVDVLGHYVPIVYREIIERDSWFIVKKNQAIKFVAPTYKEERDGNE